MATRAQQIELFLAGIRNPTADAFASGWYVKPYAAGTDDLKNIYEDAAKASAVTSKQLDAYGRALVYGDGNYKFKIYSLDPDDPANAGIQPELTFDNIKCEAVSGNSRTITSNTTLTVDDYIVLVNTTSGSVTVTLPSAALMGQRQIIIKKTVAANTMTVAAPAGQTIDGGSSTAVTAINAAVVAVSNGTNWYGSTTGAFLPLTGGTLTGALIIDPGGTTNARFEHGSTGGASAPYIDFHSGASAVDYDSRIQASGGTGSSGGGTLNIVAASAQVGGNTIWHSGNLPVDQVALAKATSTQSAAAAGSVTITWTVEEFDTGTYVDLGTQPTRFTVPAAGKYRFVASVPITNTGATSGNITAYFAASNAAGTALAIPGIASIYVDASSPNPTNINVCSEVVSLDAFSYVQVLVNNYTSGQIDTYVGAFNFPRMSAERIA